MLNTLFNLDEILFRETMANFNKIITSLYSSLNNGALESSGGFKNLIYSDNTIYEKIINISNAIMLPMAILFLLSFLVFDLSSKLSENSSMNSDTSMAHIVHFVFKLLIGVVLISNAPTIVTTTFDVANSLTKRANEYLVSEEETKDNFDMYDLMEKNLTNRGIPIKENNFGDHVSYYVKRIWGEMDKEEASEGAYGREAKILETYMDNSEIDGLFFSFIVSLLANVVIYILPFVLKLVLIRRGLELYIYLAVSPITLSFLFNKNTQQSGVNFLKSIFAYGLQLLVIFFLIYIYSSVINSFASNLLLDTKEINLNGIALEYLLYSVFCIFALFGSKSLTQRALGSF